MSKEFDDMVIKVIDTIKEIEPNCKKEQIHLATLKYFILKTCETEEIFDENLMILDKYSQNGLENSKKVKVKRIDLVEE